MAVFRGWGQPGRAEWGFLLRPAHGNPDFAETPRWQLLSQVALNSRWGGGCRVTVRETLPVPSGYAGPGATAATL